MLKNQEPSILIIDGDQFFSTLVLSCFSRVPKLKVHVLSTDPKTPARLSRLSTSFHLYNPSNDEEYIEVIREVAKKVGATVLLAVSRLGILFAIRNLKVLQQIAPVAPVPPLNSFETAQDKGLLAEFLIKNDFPIPPTLQCTLDTKFFNELEKMKFPVLLKPNMGASGQGIIEFKDCPSLEQYLEKNKNILKPCVIQSKLVGQDIACNVLAKEGKILVHTVQLGVLPNPIRFKPPSVVEMIQHEPTFQLTEKLVSKLNWSGVAQFGFFLSEEDEREPIKVLEINPRYFGRLRGSLMAGINFPYLSSLAALDKPFPISNYKNCRFIEFQDWLKVLMCSHLRKEMAKINSLKVGWRYTLKDPKPFLNSVFNKLVSLTNLK